MKQFLRNVPFFMYSTQIVRGWGEGVGKRQKYREGRERMGS